MPLPAAKKNHPWMQASDYKKAHLSKETAEETAALKQEDDQLKSTQLRADTGSSLTYRFLDDFTFIEGVKGLEAHVHDGVTKASLLVDRYIEARLPQLGMSGAGLEKVKRLLNQGYYPYKKGNQVHFDRGLLGGGNEPSKGKQAYIPRNWQGEPTIKNFKGYTDYVNTLIELSDGTLASGSRDKTIKIWDRAGNCLKTVEGHTDWVLTLIELSDGSLASGSRDKTIKRWSFPKQDPALGKLVKRPTQKKPATPAKQEITVPQPLANKEYPATLSRLGFKHYGKKEYQQAFELFQKAAKQGDIDL